VLSRFVLAAQAEKARRIPGQLIRIQGVYPQGIELCAY
jgi:hypothetical protein